MQKFTENLDFEWWLVKIRIAENDKKNGRISHFAVFICKIIITFPELFGIFLSFIHQVRLTIEELISKTSYIHSYMLLICSSGHSKKAHFQHKIYYKWKMLILIEI